MLVAKRGDDFDCFDLELDSCLAFGSTFLAMDAVAESAFEAGFGAGNPLISCTLRRRAHRKNIRRLGLGNMRSGK